LRIEHWCIHQSILVLRSGDALPQVPTRTYRSILLKSRDEFGERSLGDLTSEEILSFLV